MKTLQTVFLLAMCLSLGQSSNSSNRAITQFRRMILCVMPKSSPLLQFADYGCYCGFGGSGTPVDELDRCCQVHDQCYNNAKKHPKCFPILDNPYTNFYRYSCDKKNRVITCGSKNDECELFICECDRKAAECFAKAHWNPANNHLSSHRCK